MENKLVEEMHQMSSKLLKSYETFNNINEVDIAVSPKTTVYNEDKLTLYKYDRETEPTSKPSITTVIMSTTSLVI